MTNQEACDCIKNVDGAQKTSKKLVKEAKSLGSYDDISCIVESLEKEDESKNSCYTKTRRKTN